MLLFLFGRFAVPGVIGHQRDTEAFYFPLTAWFSQELQAGRFPLWCPLIFGGYPLLADGEIGMLYPPNILALLLLPAEFAFVLVQAANYFIAGGGTYALARVLGCGRVPAAYGGLTFALGGFMIGHLDHGNILRSAAWLPALLCCGDLALRASNRTTTAWTALAAAALGLAGLGLHPQVLLIDLVALWIYLPLRALTLESRLSLLRLVPVLGGSTLFGLAAAAVQLVPVYELAQLSSRRGGIPYANAVVGALSPFDLATLLLPYIFRADAGNVWWSLNPLWETTLYVGAVGSVLALVGLIVGRRRTIAPLLGLGLAGLALAMADYFPINLHEWLWTLPGFSSMRAPGRFRILVELSLAVLASVGLHRLLVEAGSSRTRRAILAVSALVVIALAGLTSLRVWFSANETDALRAIQLSYLTLRHDRPTLSAEQVHRGVLNALDAGNPWTMLALAVLLLAIALLWAWHRWPTAGRWWQGSLVATASAELLLVAHGFHPTLPIGALDDPSGPLRFLSARSGLGRTFILGRSDSALTSRPALFGIAQAYGYSSLPTTRSERYWTRVNEVDDELLDLWSGRYLVHSKPVAGLISAQSVLFNPDRPLVHGPAESPLGHEQFRIAPSRTDALQILSAVSGASQLPNGTTVADVIVSGGESPPEVLTIRVGAQTAEGAYDDPSAATMPIHSRATVGYRWAPRDPSGRIYPRNLYLADVRLAAPRTVERVEVRAVLPAGDFRLAGLALLDRSRARAGSLLASHREKYRLVYEDERTTIYENRDALPRAFVVAEAIRVKADDWAIVHLLQRGFDPRRQVLLEDSATPTDEPGPPLTGSVAPDRTPAQAFGPGEATIEEEGTDHVVIRATVAERGYLVLTDSFYFGWRAWLDGEEVPVERADFLFRAVGLPPGEHVVVFRFQPTTMFLGQVVSLVAWLAILGVIVLGLRQSVRRGSGTS